MRKHYFILHPLSFILFFFLLVPQCSASEDKDLIRVKGLIHLNSDVTSGEYSPEELVRAARSAGVGAIFLTENLNAKWEYGVEPLRGIIKKTVERPNLLKYGTVKYSRRLERIEKDNPGLSIMMSAEAAPFYHWTGSPFAGRLTLNDWDLQMLVTGLKPRGYGRVPTLDTGGFSRYSFKSVLLLWPLPLLVFGIFSLKRKHPRFYLSDTICWVLIVAGLFFTLKNFPFKEEIYDQYHGSRGPGPYQAAIDRVNKMGGMTFWSNPEASTKKNLGPVDFVSPSAAVYMLGTRDYTGFGCFYEGYRAVGGPGGVWDQVLKDHCEGKRSKPAWAIGELAYHGHEGNSPKAIDDVQTVFIVAENTPGNILAAMRAGRMYALRKGKEYQLQLDTFTVKYEGESVISGGNIEAAGPVTVTFGVSWQGEMKDKITAQLIRSGEIIKEFAITEPGEIQYTDTAYEPGKKVYYRLDIRGGYPNMLFSNPVFVEFEARR